MTPFGRLVILIAGVTTTTGCNTGDVAQWASIVFCIIMSFTALWQAFRPQNQAKRSADAAEMAAEAAKESVKKAETALKADHAARLEVFYDLVRTGRTWRLVLRVRNTGRSAAEGVRIDFEPRLARISWEDDSLVEHPADEALRSGDLKLAAGTDYLISIGHWDQIVRYDGFVDPIAALVRFTDIFDERHEIATTLSFESLRKLPIMGQATLDDVVDSIKELSRTYERANDGRREPFGPPSEKHSLAEISKSLVSIKEHIVPERNGSEG